MENKIIKNLENIINNYGEFRENEREQLQEIIHFKDLTNIKKKKIIREIVLEQGLGQDLTEEEILKNLDDKEKIKYLLNRLFVEDMEHLAIEKFITKVKNNELDIREFLDIHKRQPKRNYWQLILLNY